MFNIISHESSDEKFAAIALVYFHVYIIGLSTKVPHMWAVFEVAPHKTILNYYYYYCYYYYYYYYYYYHYYLFIFIIFIFLIHLFIYLFIFFFGGGAISNQVISRF